MPTPLLPFYFPRVATEKPRPVKARLSRTVQQQVDRGIARLPVLGARNPAGLSLAIELIDDWIGDEDPDDEQERDVPAPTASLEARGRFDDTAFSLAIGRRPNIRVAPIRARRRAS